MFYNNSLDGLPLSFYINTYGQRGAVQKQESKMNATVNALKKTLDTAHAAYVAEQTRLVAAGLKSKERYELLKPLKAAEDAANSAYVAAANGAIQKECNKIIAAGAPARRAAKLARSPWKQAKAAAAAARNA